MSLTLSTAPGFTEVSDSVFDAGNVASDSNLKALNAASKFGVVRNEQFYGYYKNGETVVTPVSPADGYAYSRSELRYSWSLYWSGSATGACNGTQTAPGRGPSTGAGNLLQLNFNVDQASGLVECGAAYYKSDQQNTQDGIICVITHAQRSR